MYSVVLQGEASKNGTAQAATPTFSAFTPTAGDSLIAVVWVDGNQGDFTGSMGNAAGAGNATWEKLLNYASSIGTWTAFLLKSASAVSTQPQFTFGANKDYPAIAVFKASGLYSNPYMTGVSLSSLTPGTGSDDMTSGNTSTFPLAPAMVLGIVYQTTGIDTPTTGTGFTSLGTGWSFEGSQAVSVRFEHKRVTTTAAVAATGGQASNRNSLVMALVFEEDSGVDVVERNVNTASSAGGTGVDDGTVGADRAFATLKEAVDALPATLTHPYRLICKGSIADTTPLPQATWDMITSAANYIEIVQAASDRHNGKYDTSKYRLEVTNSNAIYNNVPGHLRIDGLQIKVTVNDGGNYVGIKTTNANQTQSDVDCRVSNCIVWGVPTSGTVYGFDARPTGGGGTPYAAFWNCRAIDCSQGFESDASSPYFYNCGAYDCTYGFVADSASVVAINCLAHNCSGGGFVSTFGGATGYNASTDGSAPGSNSRTGQTFTFTDSGNNDFHLTLADAGAKGYGFTNPGSGLFLDTIDRVTRSVPWSIGPDQPEVPLTTRGTTEHIQQPIMVGFAQ